VRHYGTRSLLICARSNRELDCLIGRIREQVHDVEIVTCQTGSSETLAACQWQRHDQALGTTQE